jgi:type IX secretion system PorP/SprF family membrane protein
MKKILCFLIITYTLSYRKGDEGLYAQDFHLSQFDAAPHYFNPALTGIYFSGDADYRIYSDYRTQWRALGIKSFSTYYLAYDMPYKLYGLGGYLINNRNGAGGLNTITVMPSAAYKISNEKDTPHNLSVGAQLGIAYRSFDPNHYTYDTQFSPDASGGFDQTIPNGEAYNKTGLLKLDANMGVFYKYKKENWKVHPWAGFGIYHLNKPNQSFVKNEKDKTPMRVALELGGDCKITEEISAVPMILYMNQGKAHEVNMGVRGFYHLKDTKYHVLLGFNFRAKDAFIIQTGLKYEQHVVTFSYDVNTSYLNNYTGGRGAFELSVLLSGIKGKPLFNPKFKRGTSINKEL